jgi:HEPN domain-containing protein
MPDNKEYIKEWFEKGSHDFTTAKLAFEAGAITDTTVVLLQQASEKYLKGYLISKGWRLKKTHDLVELIDVAEKHNSDFKKYINLADQLTALYLQERYPTVPPADYPREEIASLIEQTEKLITLIKKETG